MPATPGIRFNYVAEQNNERERLEEAVAKLRVEEAKYTLESGEDMTQVRHHTCT